jgi:hypothetical protein
MNVGDRVRIRPEAWEMFCKEQGRMSVYPGHQFITAIDRDGNVMLSFPIYLWKPEDILPYDERVMLDEAIAHAEEVAQDCRETPCGDDHARLAEWLRELRSIKFPEPLPPPDPRIANLDEHRIRVEREFEGESMAYIEAMWGKETVAFNAVVRDLEAMRRGNEEPGMPLRPPETYHEAIHLVLHVRALANDLARCFGMDDQVRVSDDEAVGKKS